jgi:Transposase DDE domain
MIDSKGSDLVFTSRMWRWVPRIDVADPTSNLEALVDADLDALATALYVRTDDLLKGCPQWAPWRPAVGIAPELSDAEALPLAVLQALLGYVSEARWLRFASARLRHLFPYLPGQPGCNKRLRKLAATMVWLIRVLGRDTSLWADDVWVVDSTPVECGRSKDTVRHSDLAGWAEYGYCAAHSRYFWGLRLHLLCTLHGLPAGFALTGAKADERQVLLGILDDDTLMAGRAGQVIIGDKNYYGHDFEATLARAGLVLLRPARQGESQRPGAQFFKPMRQIIESVNDTFKGQLDLERHGGHTPNGVMTRVLQRILALTAAIWHNDHTGQPVMRSLIAYDH